MLGESLKGGRRHQVPNSAVQSPAARKGAPRRGHYELAAGREVGRYLRAMEGFASSGGMLPDQVWDVPDHPEWFMFFGRPTATLQNNLMRQWLSVVAGP